MGTPASSDFPERSNKALDLGRSSTKRFCSRCISAVSKVRLSDSMGELGSRKNNKPCGRGATRPRPHGYFQVSKWEKALQNVPAQILILNNISQHLADIFGVDGDLLALSFRGGEADLIEYAFHNCVQPPRAYVLGAFVDSERKTRNFGQGLFGELQLHAFCLQERRVLFHQRRFGLSENA